MNQPIAVRTKAQEHKEGVWSPKRQCHAPGHADMEAGPSYQRHSPYPSPSPRLPSLHVQTPSDSFQSPFYLEVSRGANFEPSLVSSSSSSLGPSDSISIAPWSSSRRGRGHLSLLASSGSSAVLDMAWSSERQMHFEVRLMRLTASAGFPLSWVENPEWLNFCTEFLPQAKSPSRKVLTRRLLPQALSSLQMEAKRRASGQNATASCDGWTGENFHHYIVFMVMVGKEVRAICCMMGTLSD